MLEFAQSYITPVTTTVTETFGSISIDIFIITGAVAFFFFFGVWRSKAALSALFFALPLAGFAFSIFPYKTKIMFMGESAQQLAVARGIVFALLLAVMYYLLSKIASAYSYGSAGGRWFDLGLLAFSCTLMLVVLYYHVLGIAALHTFGPSVYQAFGNPEYAFWWFLAALAGFFIAERR